MAVTWYETACLVAILMQEPSSWLQAAHAGWKHPASYEWMVLVNQYDLLARINSKQKPKPYPTPWNSEKKLGSKKIQSRELVLERLRQMNPKENDG